MEKRSNIEAKKSLGQHFLTGSTVPSWMCDAAAVREGETVLEIGPGTGVLTREILKRGAKIIALEADRRALTVLSQSFAEEIESHQLTLHHCDIRTVTVSEIEGIADQDFKIVANIPYYLSGFLFRTFLESAVQPTALVYLVQKEVAKRITSDRSRGEKESLLSLSVKAYGTPKYVKTVSRGHFSPAPNVDSAIVSVQNISRDNFKDLDPVFFSSFSTWDLAKNANSSWEISARSSTEIHLPTFSPHFLYLFPHVPKISIWKCGLISQAHCTRSSIVCLSKGYTTLLHGLITHCTAIHI